MNQSILLVSPSTEQLSAVCKALLDFGSSVFQADNVYGARAGLALHSPVFLLVDLDVVGVEKILMELWDNQHHARPFTLASADFHESTDRTVALKLGADICIGKPIDVDEVLAVIQAVQRRERWLMQFNDSKKLPRIVYKDLMLDPFRRRVTIQGRVIDLTTKEFDILYLLAQKRGNVLTKKEIYQAVWNTTADVDAPIVKDHISSIRKKLGFKNNDVDYIRTVFGVGYCVGWLDDEDIAAKR